MKSSRTILCVLIAGVDDNSLLEIVVCELKEELVAYFTLHEFF